MLGTPGAHPAAHPAVFEGSAVESVWRHLRFARPLQRETF